ncbi:MAG: DUF3883 domain-containing protein [Acidobacteria bacterium]|nr:DUF3883 domain-containing protein [Acidobacteriota bacterium]
MPDNQPTSLRWGVNPVGFINQQLRTLLGPTALANELIQNAEDAGASEVYFNFSDDALIVGNNSKFLACSDVTRDECANAAEGYEFCDFHRFRDVASGNKRAGSRNIGAFGIGFTSVYQISDRPEVSSGEVHWIIVPLEGRVISERIDYFDGTRFRLPWAFELTEFRQKIAAETVSPKKINDLLLGIHSSLEFSLLFLNNLTSAKVLKENKEIFSIDIYLNNSVKTVSSSNGSRTNWQLFQGNFENSEAVQDSPERRRTEVNIAIPNRVLSKEGLLFAFLPLEREKTQLPFHINADFFPSPERKALLFDDDHQGRWNRQALRTAIEVFSSNLCNIRDFLGAKNFWESLDQVRKANKHFENNAFINGRDAELKELWPLATGSLRKFDSVLTSRVEWRIPPTTFLVSTPRETDDAVLRSSLEDLGLEIVHQELSKFRKTLKDVGVRELKAEDVVNKINSTRLSEGTPLDGAPSWFRDRKRRTSLLDFLKPELEELRGLLKNCPIAIDRGQKVRYPGNLFNFVESEILRIFLNLGFESSFPAKDSHELIVKLAADFTVTDAVNLIERLEAEEIRAFASNDPEDYRKLVKWLVGKAKSLEPETQKALRDLEIWPTSHGFDSLDGLAIPGGFDDPIGLARFVDLNRLGLDSSELKAIGAKSLNFSSYIIDHVKDYFEGNENVDDEIKQRLFELVREKRKRWEEDEPVKATIADLPLVKCTDGKYRPGNKVYFDSEVNKEILGYGHHYVLPSDDKRDFLASIGVAESPRIDDLLRLIDDAITPPTSINRERVNTVVRIIRHIGKGWSEIKDESRDYFDKLKAKQWLPEEKNLRNWKNPKDLHSPRKRYLFESVGKFVDLGSDEEKVDRGIYDFLEDLGVNTEPSEKQVVDHLLAYCKENKPVDNRVYDFLQNKIESREIKRLRNSPFIWDEKNSRYLKANQCFWNKVDLGRYRQKLSDSYSQYKKLFSKLDVKEDADSSDAVEVLREIYEEFSPENKELDEEARRVAHTCWRLLDKASDDLFEKVGTFQSVVNKLGHLDFPTKVFFDNFPGIAESLGLAPNVVEIRPEIFKPMHGAGVKNLSEVVQIEVRGYQDDRRNEQLEGRLRWNSCFERILQKHDPENFDSRTLTVLSNLKLFEVSSLAVRYSVPEMSRTSEQVSADSAYDRWVSTIYFIKNDLTSLSSEIARILISGSEFSQIAPTIKEVLGSESESQANMSLDKYGFPKVDTSVIKAAESQELTNFVDTDESDFASQDETDNEGHRGDASSEHPGESPPSRRQKEDEQKDLLDGVQFTGPVQDRSPETDLNGNYQSQFDLSPKTQDEESHGKSDTRRNRPRFERKDSETTRREQGSKARSKKRGRLLSYVAEDGDEDTKAEDPHTTQLRLKVDRLGIEAVVRFEEEAGRYPEEMAPNFKGFDLKSFGSEEERENNKEPVRYIEVKSITGIWGEKGVGLTKSQFEEARKKGDRYWLYVVEYANSDAIVHPIRNPARRATHYFFDHGWKKVSRIEERTDP